MLQSSSQAHLRIPSNPAAYLHAALLKLVNTPAGAATVLVQHALQAADSKRLNADPARARIKDGCVSVSLHIWQANAHLPTAT